MSINKLWEKKDTPMLTITKNIRAMRKLRYINDNYNYKKNCAKYGTTIANTYMLCECGKPVFVFK